MKIEFNLKIIFMIILFFLINSIDTYIIFLIFIFIHELIHLLVGIIIGKKPKKLSLNPLGLSIEFYSYGKKKFLYLILFYLSGPLVNFIIALIFNYININQEMKLKIIYTNLAIGVFNLIPIIPLDGGKILKEILKYFIGYEKANKCSIILSQYILIFITMAYSVFILKVKNIYILLLIIYLWYLYFIEQRKYEIFCKTLNSIKKLQKSL